MGGEDVIILSFQVRKWNLKGLGDLPMVLYHDLLSTDNTSSQEMLSSLVSAGGATSGHCLFHLTSHPLINNLFYPRLVPLRAGTQQPDK